MDIEPSTIAPPAIPEAPAELVVQLPAPALLYEGLLLNLLLPPIGLVVCCFAKAQIIAQNRHGRGLATAGIIAGVITTLIFIPIVLLLVVFAIGFSVPG